MVEPNSERVLVVIPLYNGARFIDETLQSVISQTHPHYEVVVVDDGSSDDSVEKVSRWSHADARVRLRTKGSSGIASTRNHAMAASTPGASYVVFLDQDDVLPSDFFSRAVSCLSQRSDAVGAAALVDLVDADGRPFDDGAFAAAMVGGDGSSSLEASDGREVRFEDVFVHNRLCPPSCVMLKLDIVTEVGGPDTSYVVADDWDLMLRVLRHGPVLFLPGARVGYRRHGFNASDSAGDQNIQETRRVWARTYFSRANSDAQRRALRQKWRTRQRRTARAKAHSAVTALGRGELLIAASGLLDALAHAVSLRPLRYWARPAR